MKSRVIPNLFRDPITRLKEMLKRVQHERIQFLILMFILILAAFFRFYRIDEYMTFLGDEGRDVLVVKRMLIDHKFTLLGPITSVGSIYMGPIYYYLMVPFLWLFSYNPLGPAVMVALLSLATVYLIFKIGNDFFHPVVGLTASFLYGISPLTVAYGRSSWNPNVVPFFAVLLIYSLMKTVIKKKNNYLILTGLSLGTLIQLHYTTFMFFMIIGAVLIILRPKLPLKTYLFSLGGFLLAYSPFILFELRHELVNLKGAWRFFWQQNKESQAQNLSIIAIINDVIVRLIWRLVVIVNAEISKIYLIALSLVTFLYFRKIKKDENKFSALKIILIWLTVGVLSFGLYRGVIYDYYFGSLFAVPFLLTGILIYYLWQKGAGFRPASILILVILTIFNIINTPLKIEPNNMVKNTREIARFVSRLTENKAYNFALIAGKNSDHAYRYFLEIANQPPTVIENEVIDPKRQTVTNQLLVVCEEKVCQPLGHPLWEIAGFGQAQIDGEWKVSTARVFKLSRL